MSTTSRRTYALLVAAFVILMAASQARAWSPPDGPDFDQADRPPTPTTLLTQAHGYIIQNGISVLYNDGYWFAAQFLREWQQELLNGVRYADVYRGRQNVHLEVCGLYFFCYRIYTVADWPLAGDHHYFNPDTERGLDVGSLNEFDNWATVLGIPLTPGVSFHIDVDPELQDEYPSALEMFEEEYANALDAYFDRLTQDFIGGRRGTALAIFYLGWASHFLQDLTVVHHTFDAFLPWTHHNDYEHAADGLGETFAPIADGHKRGIYEDELRDVDCAPGSRTCFLVFAAHESHDPVILQRASEEVYDINVAVLRAQNLQAGLYAAFLTDIGRRPVHISAVIAAL